MCNPRTVDGRHLRHSGGPWGPSNPGGRRSYFPCELSASVTLEYEKEGGPASANYGAVPASRGGDRSTGGTAPDATRHCCRSRPTATETSVERPPRPRRSRTWPLAAIGGGMPAAVKAAADTAGVARPQLPPGRCADRSRRSRRLRSRRQRPCKCWTYIGPEQPPPWHAMARRKEGVGGADDEGRVVGRAGRERVHVGGGFVQRERHEQLLCVPHSVQGTSGTIYVQESPPPGMR